MPSASIEEYSHPATVIPSGDVGVDFRTPIEEYDYNLTQYLPRDEDAPILDVGCGWGQFLFWLRLRGYTNAHGIDVGAGQEQHCRALGLSVTRVADSREFLEAHPNEYALITLHHLIEHVDAREGVQLLRAAFNSLRPGGRVILQTPNMSSIGALYLRYIELTHVIGYTEHSLHQIVLLAGFTKVCIFGNRTAKKFKPRRLIFLMMQACARLVWRTMLVAELGSEAPRHLQKNLFAVGDKESR